MLELDAVSMDGDCAAETDDAVDPAELGEFAGIAHRPEPPVSVVPND